MFSHEYVNGPEFVSGKSLFFSETKKVSSWDFVPMIENFDALDFSGSVGVVPVVEIDRNGVKALRDASGAFLPPTRAAIVAT